MPSRALIVAIEHYAQAVDLANEIVGATKAGERFFDWLTTTKKLAASDVYVCADPAGQFPGAVRFSTDREAIVDAMAALVAAGQDQTEELLVFFSGHGYCFQESVEKRAIDVLVAGDFVSAAASGTKCLKLQEVQEKLWSILGGAHHYYFVDACRTLVNDDEIEPIGLGRKLGKTAQRGRPAKYTLFSTAFGAPAAITSDFAPALLDGLEGKSRAKGLTPNGELWVQFPLLATYVQQRVSTQRMDQSTEGNGSGLILQIAPLPTYTCTVVVDDAKDTEDFVASMAPIGQPAFAKTTPFHGKTVALPYNPGNLELTVTWGAQTLIRVDPPAGTALDFFDDSRAVFKRPVLTRDIRSAPAAPAPPPPPPSSMSVVSLPDMQAEAVNLKTGDVTVLNALATPLPPGDYAITMSERGIPISRELTTLAPGSRMQLGAEPYDPVRASIVTAVNGAANQPVVAFSETLGYIGNRDLALWLSIMGASHILRDPSTFSKLASLQLDDVTVHPPQSSAIYLLGASSEQQPFTLTVGDQTQLTRVVPQLVGVYQATQTAAAGPQLVTIKAGDREARTFAAHCLPNRMTFFVVSPGSRGQMRINQFMLPMHHLQQYLPASVDYKIRQSGTPLRAIRTAVTFQQQFARQREIAPTTREDRDTWDELLYGKWIDPVMSLLACYEIIRRGNQQTKDMVRQTVVPNLREYFPGLADTEAIAELLNVPSARPASAPLFREGLLAFPDWEDALPLRADDLDFNYIWTTWRRRRA